MTSGSATGTVRLWMDDQGWGVIDLPDQPEGCWAEASVVEGIDGTDTLRAGQTVDVEWTTPGPEDYDTKALRVVLRDELQATPWRMIKAGGVNPPRARADNSGMHATRVMRRAVVAALVAVLVLAIMSVGSIHAQAATYTAPRFAAKLPASTTQVVRTVRTNHWCAEVYCTVTQGWVKTGGQWKIKTRWDGRRAIYRSTIGPNGFAAIGMRREGDGRTPSGVYRIAVTFSTTTTNPGAMPWRRRLPTSTVTNYNNWLYNTWIEERGRTDGDRASMRYGFWVGYNNPRLTAGVGPAPVRGLGSGIFYHTSPIDRKWIPTQGCTQVGEPSEMRWILRWLRPGANPRVVNNI